MRPWHYHLIHFHPKTLQKEQNFRRAKWLQLRVEEMDECQLGGFLFPGSGSPIARGSNSGI